MNSPNTTTLTDGGLGVRFEVQHLPTQQILPAFLIQYDGKQYAYLNQCAHIATELDWQASHFFDSDGQWLVCASHGALYDPQTGICVSGPCAGAALTPIPISIFSPLNPLNSLNSLPSLQAFDAEKQPVYILKSI